jgi:hypothetical protein
MATGCGGYIDGVNNLDYVLVRWEGGFCYGKIGKRELQAYKRFGEPKESIKAFKETLHEVELKADDLNADLKPERRVFIFRRNGKPTNHRPKQ